jgi:hypothetical protein
MKNVNIRPIADSAPGIAVPGRRRPHVRRAIGTLTLSASIAAFLAGCSKNEDRTIVDCAAEPGGRAAVTVDTGKTSTVSLTGRHSHKADEQGRTDTVTIVSTSGDRSFVLHVGQLTAVGSYDEVASGHAQIIKNVSTGEALALSIPMPNDGNRVAIEYRCPPHP